MTHKMSLPVYLLALGFGLGTTVAVISVATNGLTGSELAPNKALSTLPYGLQFLGVMISALASSILQSFFGRKIIIFIAGILGIIAGIMGIVAIAHSHFILFCFSHFILGIFLANIALLRFAVLDITPTSLHSKALSMVMFGGTFAAIFGPLISRNMPSLITNLNVYQASYAAISIIAFLITLLVLVLKFPNSKKNTVTKTVTVRQLLRQRVFIFALVCGGVTYALMNLIMINSSIQMKNNGFSFTAVSYYIQIHVFAMFFPSLFNMKILDAMGIHRFLLLGIALQLLTSVIFIFGQNATTFMISLLLLGLAWNILYTTCSYIVGRAFSSDDMKFKAQGTQDLFIAFMSSVGAFTAGLVLDTLGWNNQHILAIVATLLLLLMYFWARRALTTKIQSIESQS